MMNGATELLKKDLAGYARLKDMDAFNRAVTVASREKISWKDLETWARAEGALEAFRELKKAYCKIVKAG